MAWGLSEFLPQTAQQICARRPCQGCTNMAANNLGAVSLAT